MEHSWLNHIQNKFSLNPNFNLNSFQEGNSPLVQASSTSPNAHVQLSPVVRSPNSSPNADQLLVSGSQSLSTSGMVSSFSEMRMQPPAYSFISRLIEPQRSSPNAQLSPAVRSRNSSPKADQLLSSGSQSLSPIEMDSFFSGMSSFVQLPVCSPGSQLVQTPNSSPIAQLLSSVRSHNSSPNADQLFTSGSQRSSPPSMNPSSYEMKVPNLFAQSPFYPSALCAILGDPPAYSESRQCTQVDERSTYAVLETYQPHQTYHELQGSRSFPATDALSCLNSLNSEQFYTSVLDSYQAQYPPAREDGGQFRLGQDGIGSAGSSINSSAMIDHEQNSGDFSFSEMREVKTESVAVYHQQCTQCGAFEADTDSSVINRSGNYICDDCIQIIQRQNLRQQNKKKKKGPALSRRSDQICCNCKTQKTSLWRRSQNGEFICNPCGLYYKLHNRDRPQEMRKDSIQTRNRNKPKKC
ncbi:trans-acting T-cell-specific transcription factor GATA-3 [Trichonephila clavata]|uniref:Trans-acting T-cell-specific transcription factor GATA-3 n=1 Tax=Trichonephila clavata TaxID=2740835 RepID=A0A8X6L7I7_TRICU|nr:trans-acting T-cell-specific transcription factor GATA-3 [Trichonephila clavata]